MLMKRTYTIAYRLLIAIFCLGGITNVPKLSAYPWKSLKRNLTTFQRLSPNGAESLTMGANPLGYQPCWSSPERTKASSANVLSGLCRPYCTVKGSALHLVVTPPWGFWPLREGGSSIPAQSKSVFLGIEGRDSDTSAETAHKPGEIIVWLKKDYPASLFYLSLTHPYTSYKSPYPHPFVHIKEFQPLSKELNIYLLKGVVPEMEQQALSYLRQHSRVQFAQLNHIVESRATLDSIPSDPRFAQQWALNNTGQTGGTIDELNSVVGLVLASDLDDKVRACLTRTQHELFDRGGELCMPG